MATNEQYFVKAGVAEKTIITGDRAFVDYRSIHRDSSGNETSWGSVMMYVRDSRYPGGWFGVGEANDGWIRSAGLKVYPKMPGGGSYAAEQKYGKDQWQILDQQIAAQEAQKQSGASQKQSGASQNQQVQQQTAQVQTYNIGGVEYILKNNRELVNPNTGQTEYIKTKTGIYRKEDLSSPGGITYSTIVEPGKTTTVAKAQDKVITTTTTEEGQTQTVETYSKQLVGGTAPSPVDNAVNKMTEIGESKGSDSAIKSAFQLFTSPAAGIASTIDYIKGVTERGNKQTEETGQKPSFSQIVLGEMRREDVKSFDVITTVAGKASGKTQEQVVGQFYEFRTGGKSIPSRFIRTLATEPVLEPFSTAEKTALSYTGFAALGIGVGLAAPAVAARAAAAGPTAEKLFNVGSKAVWPVVAGVSTVAAGVEVYKQPAGTRAEFAGAMVSTDILPALIGGSAGYAQGKRLAPFVRQDIAAVDWNRVKLDERGSVDLLALARQKPKDAIKEIDLRPVVDISGAEARFSTDYTVPMSNAERAMIIRQYSLTPTEIAIAKQNRLSLNDILSIRNRLEVPEAMPSIKTAVLSQPRLIQTQEVSIAKTAKLSLNDILTVRSRLEIPTTYKQPTVETVRFDKLVVGTKKSVQQSVTVPTIEQTIGVSTTTKYDKLVYIPQPTKQEPSVIPAIIPLVTPSVITTTITDVIPDIVPDITPSVTPTTTSIPLFGGTGSGIGSGIFSPPKFVAPQLPGFPPYLPSHSSQRRPRRRRGYFSFLEGVPTFAPLEAMFGVKMPAKKKAKPKKKTARRRSK